MNERDFVLRKSRRSGSEIDWSIYRRLQIKYLTGLKLRSANIKEMKVKSFWKIMKNIFPGNKKKVTTPQSIKTDDGKTVIEQPPIAQRFNEFVTGAVSRLLQLLDYL